VKNVLQLFYHDDAVRNRPPRDVISLKSTLRNPDAPVTGADDVRYTNRLTRLGCTWSLVPIDRARYIGPTTPRWWSSLLLGDRIRLDQDPS